MDYFTGFPTTEDSLGGTQLKFFTNWASVKAFVDTNHYDFANTLAGNHKWVLYGRQTGTFPDTSSPSALTIATYAAADATPRTQLWFQPQNDATGANAIQLTAGDVTDTYFSSSQNLTPTPTNTISQAGWTFLPGGMLLQYGRVLQVSGSQPNQTGTITFPVAFSVAPYSITASWFNASSTSREVGYRAPTTTNFLYVLDSSWPNSGGLTYAITWMAIGKA